MIMRKGMMIMIMMMMIIIITIIIIIIIIIFIILTNSKYLSEHINIRYRYHRISSRNNFHENRIFLEAL